jgi:hypothetical protein
MSFIKRAVKPLLPELLVRAFLAFRMAQEKPADPEWRRREVGG